MGEGRLVVVAAGIVFPVGATAVDMAGGSSTIGDSVNSPMNGLWMAFSDDWDGWDL